MPPNINEHFVSLLRALSATAVIALAWKLWHFGFNDFATSTDLLEPLLT